MHHNAWPSYPWIRPFIIIINVLTNTRVLSIYNWETKTFLRDFLHFWKPRIASRLHGWNLWMNDNTEYSFFWKKKRFQMEEKEENKGKLLAFGLIDGTWNHFFSWIENWFFVFFFFSFHFVSSLRVKVNNSESQLNFVSILYRKRALKNFHTFPTFFLFNSCGLSLACFHLFANENWAKISYTLQETTKTTKFQNFRFFWKFQKIYVKKLPTRSRKPIF